MIHCIIYSFTDIIIEIRSSSHIVEIYGLSIQNLYDKLTHLWEGVYINIIPKLRCWYSHRNCHLIWIYSIESLYITTHLSFQVYYIHIRTVHLWALDGCRSDDKLTCLRSTDQFSSRRSCHSCSEKYMVEM